MLVVLSTTSILSISISLVYVIVFFLLYIAIQVMSPRGIFLLKQYPWNNIFKALSYSSGTCSGLGFSLVFPFRLSWLVKRFSSPSGAGKSNRLLLIGSVCALTYYLCADLSFLYGLDYLFLTLSFSLSSSLVYSFYSLSLLLSFSFTFFLLYSLSLFLSRLFLSSRVLSLSLSFSISHVLPL